MIEVTDVALRQAAGEGMDAFIGVFTGAYKKEMLYKLKNVIHFLKLLAKLLLFFIYANRVI